MSTNSETGCPQGVILLVGSGEPRMTTFFTFWQEYGPDAARRAISVNPGPGPVADSLSGGEKVSESDGIWFASEPFLV